MKTIIIDCGHGGVDSNNKYTTAPAKMFTFPTGEIAYEGYYNRLTGKLLGEYLKDVYTIFYTVAPSNPIDLSLKDRIKFVNMFSVSDAILISLHSNASSSHTARGFEVWTSIGETKSDKLATLVGEQIKEAFPNSRFRADMIDGDLDKESNFYVLKNSKCPAILLENLFFDNYEDFNLLRNSNFREKLAYSISKGIKKYLNNE